MLEKWLKMRSCSADVRAGRAWVIKPRTAAVCKAISYFIMLEEAAMGCCFCIASAASNKLGAVGALLLLCAVEA